MKYIFFFFLFCILNSSELSAQTSEVADTISIKTKNDSIYVGILVKITTDSLIINNEEHGQMSFNRADIKDFQKGVISNRLRGSTNSSVPFFVQTAMVNGNGNHYYKNYYIFGNELNFGVSDNLNLSLGFETATLIFGDGQPIIQLGAKYGVAASEDVHFAVSSKYYLNEYGSVLFVSSPITFGNRRTNFTISPNYLRFSNDSEFAILANLSVALSKNWRFILDLGYIDGERPIITLIEHTFKSGFTLSVGTYYVTHSSIPNLSFSIPFGKWK